MSRPRTESDRAPSRPLTLSSASWRNSSCEAVWQGRPLAPSPAGRGRGVRGPVAYAAKPLTLTLSRRERGYCLPLLEGWHHLLRQELQTAVHGFLGQEPARIQLRRDARNPQHVLKLVQAVDDALRAAKDHSGLQEVFIGGVGQPLEACLPHRILFGPSTPPRILEELAH